MTFGYYARSVYDGHLTSSHTNQADFMQQLSRPDHWWFDLDSQLSTMLQAHENLTKVHVSRVVLGVFLSEFTL